MPTLILLAVAALADPPATAPPPAGRVIRAADAPAYQLPGGSGVATLFLNAATGSPEIALDRLDLVAGAQVPPHTHDDSAEILYIQQGTVRMTIGGQPFDAAAGDAVYIPRGTEHSATVGDGPLVAVQIYAGPGPEQRFTTGVPVTR